MLVFQLWACKQFGQPGAAESAGEAAQALLLASVASKPSASTTAVQFADVKRAGRSSPKKYLPKSCTLTASIGQNIEIPFVVSLIFLPSEDLSVVRS